MNSTLKKKLDSLPRREAAFIEPMECALVPNVPDGPQWVYEIKLDGYRAVAVKSGNNVTPECPFVNLPETRQSRWGEGLTADDMKKCVWVRPELVAQIEFHSGRRAIIFGTRNSPDCATTKTLGAWSRSMLGKREWD